MGNWIVEIIYMYIFVVTMGDGEECTFFKSPFFLDVRSCSCVVTP